MNWRLLTTGLQSAAWNMAVEEAILKSIQAGEVKPTVRFYGWQPAAVSVGYFQNLEEEVDLAACRRQGVDIVRRLTGGRAVFHDDELTYSLLISEAADFLPEAVVDSYRVISRGLLAGLQELGIEAELVSHGDKRSRKSKSAACFDAPSWYELCAEGKKIIGSAQTRKQGVILQHGSILQSQDLEQLLTLFKFSSQQAKRQFQRLYRRKATTIREVAGEQFTFKDLATAFAKGLEQGLDIKLEPGELTSRERKTAEKLAAEKYSDDSWNYKL